MELTIKKQDLINGLMSVSGCVKKFLTIESKETVNFHASNSMFSFSSTCDAEIKKEGTVCVEYNRILGFAKNYSGDEVKLKVTSAGWLHIDGNNIKMRLPGSKENQQVNALKTLENIIEIQDLKNAINMTSFAIGNTVSRPAFMGLNIDSNKVTCANGFMVAQYSLSCNCKDILIPAKAAQEIEKIIRNDSVVSTNGVSIQVESGNIKFKTALLESSYPNLNTIILTENPHKIKINKAAIESFINIIEGIVSVESDPIVKFVFEKGKINIISKKLDTGEGDGFIECDYAGDEISIGFNVKYLKSVIQSFGSEETINFHIKDSSTVVIVTSDNIENYRTAIMPVKIKW